MKELVKEIIVGPPGIRNSSENTLYIITFDDDQTTIHHAALSSGQQLTTPLENIERYNNEADWITRLNELGVDIEKKI